MSTTSLIGRAGVAPLCREPSPRAEQVTQLVLGETARVLEARVTTVSGRSRAFTGSSMRAALGLRDTWFSVSKNAPAAAVSR